MWMFHVDVKEPKRLKKGQQTRTVEVSGSISPKPNDRGSIYEGSGSSSGSFGSRYTSCSMSLRAPGVCGTTPHPNLP